MLHRRVIFAGMGGLVVAATGCGHPATESNPPTRYVSLSIVDSSAFAGAEIAMRIVNLSHYSLAFGPCDWNLERRSRPVGWDAVEGAGRPCNDVLIGVPPLATRVLPFLLPPSLSPGEYRIRFARIALIGTRPPGEGTVPAAQLTTNGFPVR